MVHSKHTTKVFDSDLQELARTIAEMGGLAERQIAEAMEALATRDSGRARRIIAADATIDAMQRNIEERAVETIARRQPVAGDLRQIVGILRIATEIERIGDLAKNIGKRIIAINSEDASRGSTRGVSQMAALMLVLSCGMSSTVSPATMSRRRSKFGRGTKTLIGCAQVYHKSFSLI